MTILVDIIPTKAAGIVHSVIGIIGFLSLSLAAWISLLENIRQYTRNIETLAMVPIPVWWVSSFITFGLSLSAIYMLRYAAPSSRTSENLMRAGSN